MTVPVCVLLVRFASFRHKCVERQRATAAASSRRGTASEQVARSFARLSRLSHRVAAAATACQSLWLASGTPKDRSLVIRGEGGARNNPVRAAAFHPQHQIFLFRFLFRWRERRLICAMWLTGCRHFRPSSLFASRSVARCSMFEASRCGNAESTNLWQLVCKFVFDGVAAAAKHPDSQPASSNHKEPSDHRKTFHFVPSCAVGGRSCWDIAFRNLSFKSRPPQEATLFPKRLIATVWPSRLLTFVYNGNTVYKLRRCLQPP